MKAFRLTITLVSKGVSVSTKMSEKEARVFAIDNCMGWPITYESLFNRDGLTLRLERIRLR